MGVNADGLALLALARASGADFSRTVTIGRMRMSIPPEDLDHFFRRRGRGDLADRLAADPGDGYCEHMLKVAFDADVVQSIDVSDYEQASIQHDMNKPLAPTERFSAVLDFGTLEHVFNVPVAFDNVAALCAPGGHIMHVLPSNNMSGHGFYQFSPEFFFQIYAPERGFAGTRVFGVRGGAPWAWYEIHSPRELRKRVDLTSGDQLHLLALTRKVGSAPPLAESAVQQSDYMALWAKEARKVKAAPRRSVIERIMRAALRPIRHRAKVMRKDISRGRADVTRCNVFALTPMPKRDAVQVPDRDARGAVGQPG